MYDDRRFASPIVETMVVFHQAKDAVVKALNEELEEIGVSYTQAYVLVALKMSDKPLTVSEIAHFLFRELHSTSGLIARMEKYGYIERIPAPDDKRCIQVQLTSKGIECADEVAKRTLDLYDRLLSMLSDEQLRQFKKCLRGLRNQAMNDLGFQVTGLPRHISMQKLNEWLSLIRCRQTNLPSKLSGSTDKSLVSSLR